MHIIFDLAGSLKNLKTNREFDLIIGSEAEIWQSQ